MSGKSGVPELPDLSGVARDLSPHTEPDMTAVHQNHKGALKALAAILALSGGTIGCGAPAEELDDVGREVGSTEQRVMATSPSTWFKFYDVNLENMTNGDCLQGTPDDCNRKWANFVNQMAGKSYAPDIINVQQVDPVQRTELGQTLSQLTELKNYIEYKTGLSYGAIVALSNPTQQYGNLCRDKWYQTNAIIYRTGRFSVSSQSTLTAKNDKSGSCSTAGNNQREVGLVASLYDSASGKTVRLVNYHFPTANAGGDACTGINMTDARNAAAASAGNVYIIAGDANKEEFTSTGAEYSWHSDMRTAGYTDEFWNLCGGGQSCLNSNHWTFASNTLTNKRRLDFTFVKGQSNITSETVFPFSSTVVQDWYSDHRGMMLDIAY
jgi:endonuclease/exonuclease/phosphatase family metal-dependent hydrolase